MMPLPMILVSAATAATQWCNLTKSSIKEVPLSEWRAATVLDIRCVPDTSCEGLESWQVAGMGENCGGWRGCFSYAGPVVLKEVTGQCLRSIPGIALFFLSAEQIGSIPPKSFANLPLTSLTALPIQACRGLVLPQFQFINCSGLEPGCFRRLANPVLHGLGAHCMESLQPEVFYDMPVDVFLDIPVESLVLTPSQVGLLSSVCAVLNATHLDNFNKQGLCSSFRGRCLELIPAGVLREMPLVCLEQVSNTSFAKLTGVQVAALTPQQFHVLSPSQLESLTFSACSAVTAEQLASNPYACTRLPLSCRSLCETDIAVLAASVVATPQHMHSVPVFRYVVVFALLVGLISFLYTRVYGKDGREDSKDATYAALPEETRLLDREGPRHPGYGLKQA
eukprot:TRINITY_DN1493_c2_g1_i1.p1 TRINITY_DN1493_c2_g1~~TRINITY_DN1493_c2_g1_i1.p1  ORF type:complete len:414 (+),score=61.30 TRINITY_DN1493_c2_g1_i1:61-1242(+)